jgi:hypothetical protein
MGGNFQYPAASSEAFWPNESVGQVNGEKDGDGTAKDIVQQHRVLSSQPVAGLRVGKAEGEKDDRCADKNDVDHHSGSFGLGDARQAKGAVQKGDTKKAFWRGEHPSISRVRYGAKPDRHSRAAGRRKNRNPIGISATSEAE